MDINVSSQIVVQTAAQWAADATVYSAKRILVTSDAYYGSTDQRKFKIADGTQTWANLDYVPIAQTLAQVLANGNSVDEQSILSQNGKSTLQVFNDYIYLLYNNVFPQYGDFAINDAQTGLSHGIKIMFDAPIIYLAQGTASRIVETDASKNLTFVAKNTAYNLNLGITAGTVLEGNRITQTITNGVTDKAPSEDAVYDALTLKANLTDSRFIIRTSDTTRYTNTGDTNENVLTSLLISAGSYTNKVFEVYIKTIFNNTANNRTLRMYFNTTPNLTGIPVLAATYTGNSAGGSFSRKFKDLGTTIKNYIAPTTSFSNFEASTTQTATENTLSVDLTGNMYIVITAQNAVAGDSAIVDFCYTQNLT